jgi:DNA-binding transcriptional LysR family regulator
MQGPGWDDLRLFLAVQRAGSFAAAARDTRLNGSTVGRRIARLERALGATLFERHVDGPRLTRMGLEILAHAERAEEEIAALSDRARDADREIAGPVRLTGSEVALGGWVTPNLGSLRERAPGVELVLLHSTEALSLPRGEADLALRLRSEGQAAAEANVLVRRLETASLRPYASVRYLKTHRIGPRSAARHVVLVYLDNRLDYEDRAWMRTLGPNVVVGLRVNTMGLMARAIADGAGVGLLFDAYARGYPQLRPVGPAVRTLGIWLAVRRELSRVARVRTVADWLVERVRNE